MYRYGRAHRYLYRAIDTRRVDCQMFWQANTRNVTDGRQFHWRCASAGTERNTVNRALAPQRSGFPLPWPDIVALPAHKYCTRTHTVRMLASVCVFTLHTPESNTWSWWVRRYHRRPPGLRSYHKNKAANVCGIWINLRRRTREKWSSE